MENLTIAQILDRMDIRTEQLERLIANNTRAVEHIARIADNMEQRLHASEQRDQHILNMLAQHGEVMLQILRILNPRI